MHSFLNPRHCVDTPSPIPSQPGRQLYSVVGTRFEALLSLHAINQLQARDAAETEHGFFAASLKRLGIRYSVSDRDRDRIVAAGSALVVANQPFGAVENLILGDVLTQTRPDVRLFGSHLLAQLFALQPWLIPADPFGGEEATGASLAPMKAALRWLRSGGMIATCPAGAASHLHVRRRGLVDPPWSVVAAALARRTGAPVVPIYFEARNCAHLRSSTLLHPRGPKPSLERELHQQDLAEVALRVGNPISADALRKFPEHGEATRFLRFKTYCLATAGSSVMPRFRAQPPSPSPAIAEPAVQVNPLLLKAEVAELPPEALLLQQGHYSVHVTGLAGHPSLAHEISRLSEQAAGTPEDGPGDGASDGLARPAESHHLHVFTWNSESNEVMGGCRLGLVDEILSTTGTRGLYASKRYKFRSGFLQRLGPALELSRLFIRPEYQRKPLPQALLWRGLGQFLVRNPQFRSLVGAVRVSRNYKSPSRRLLAEFLDQIGADEDVGEALMVKRQSQHDENELPALLKRYLKLKARVYGFSRDPSFSDCLEGLIVADLREAAPNVLKRLMGAGGYASYISSAA